MELKHHFAQDTEGNIIPGATVYLYYAGTTNIVSGLQDAQGNSLPVPFYSNEDGLIQYAAPNGVYDLRAVSGLREYTVQVQCFDVNDAGSLKVSSPNVDDEKDMSEWLSGLSHKYAATGVYDILFVYGQSNALGKAILGGDTSGFPSPSRKSLMWDVSERRLISIAQDVQSWSRGSDSTSTGHAWGAFANEWYSRTGRGIILVLGAEGGKTVAQLSKGAGTSFYENAIEGMQTLETYLQGQSQIEIGERFCIYHQGESDQSAGTDWATYRVSLTDLIEDIRTDCGVYKFGICTVGCPENRLETSWQVIQNAQRYTADKEPGVFIAYDGCPGFSRDLGLLGNDGVHYKQKGYNQMGYSAAVSAAGNILGSEKEDSSAQDLRYGRINGGGWSDIHRVACSLYSDGGWKIRSKDNGGGAIRSMGVRSVTDMGDYLRVELSSRAAAYYSFGATLTNSFVNNMPYEINAYVKTASSGNASYLDIYFFADLTIGVKTTTADLYDGARLEALSTGGFLDTLFNASTDGDICTITHPEIKHQPSGTLYADNGFSDLSGAVFVRSDAVQTRVAARKVDTSGNQANLSNPVVSLGFKAVKITPENLRSLSGVLVTLTADYSMA